MGFVLLGILNSQAAGAVVSYWLSLIGGTGQDEGNSNAVDSQNNVYSIGYTTTDTGTGQDFLVIKQDVDGAILWQKRLGASNGQILYDVVVDSSNNLFVVGRDSDTLYTVIFKFDSSGTLLLERSFSATNLTGAYAGIGIDSSGNFYIGGNANSKGFIAKYNSAGTLQWSRQIGGSNDYFVRVAVSPSGDVYGFGRTTNAGAGSVDFFIVKYNTSGTIQWQRVFGGGGVELPGNIALDSAGNLYVSGFTTSAGVGSYDSLLVKYNSSGTVQWQRILGGASTEENFGVSVDSSDNIYIIGLTPSAGEGSGDYLFAKYDSSGTIQWQRVLGGAGLDTGKNIAFDSNDNLQIIGTTRSAGLGESSLLLGKVPNDGSLTGTYVLDGTNIVYAASSLTAASSTLTAATSSFSSSSLSATTPTVSFTPVTTTLTEYLATL